MSPEELVEVRDEAKRELLKEIVEWCSKNGQAESRFLTPHPAHYIFTFSLFDWLSEQGFAKKEEIGEWFNTMQECLEKEKAAE